MPTGGARSRSAPTARACTSPARCGGLGVAVRRRRRRGADPEAHRDRRGRCRSPARDCDQPRRQERVRRQREHGWGGRASRSTTSARAGALAPRGHRDCRGWQRTRTGSRSAPTARACTSPKTERMGRTVISQDERRAGGAHARRRPRLSRLATHRTGIAGGCPTRGPAAAFSATAGAGGDRRPRSAPPPRADSRRDRRVATTWSFGDVRAPSRRRRQARHARLRAPLAPTRSTLTVTDDAGCSTSLRVHRPDRVLQRQRRRDDALARSRCRPRP